MRSVNVSLRRPRDLSTRTTLILGGSALLAALLVWFLWVIFVPVDRDSPSEVITIPSGAGLSEITRTLDQEHIIHYPRAFQLWMWLSGSNSRIQPGSYELSGALNYRQIRTMLVSGDVTRQRLTIPEGWTLAQIAAQLQKQTIADGGQFIALARAANFPHLIQGATPNLPLEGYLFPDTYFFSPGTSPQQVIETMLQNFSSKVTPLQPKVLASGLSLHQVVTLASIVEREARTADDRRIVAGILLKRLKSGIPLGSDVTSLYELGDFNHQLTAADLARNTPYNTRLNQGLPPTPIGNPGQDPIQAVLEPKDTPYLFFLADKDGVIHYAKTQKEHDANKAKYLR